MPPSPNHTIKRMVLWGLTLNNTILFLNLAQENLLTICSLCLRSSGLLLYNGDTNQPRLRISKSGDHLRIIEISSRPPGYAVWGKVPTLTDFWGVYRLFWDTRFQQPMNRLKHSWISLFMFEQIHTSFAVQRRQYQQWSANNMEDEKAELQGDAWGIHL